MSSPLCSSHASATCAGVAPSPPGHLVHHGRRAHVGVEVLALKPRVTPPVVALGILLRAPRGAGQEAAAQRAEGHQADPELPQHGDQVAFEVPLPERVFALQRGDRVHRVGAPDRRLARLGQAEEADLALPHQLSHRADHLLDRHGRIHPVLVKEVDAVGPEPAKRGLDRLTDVLGTAVGADQLVAVEAEAELGGENDPVATAFEGAAEHLLVGERPVGLGGIEEA